MIATVGGIVSGTMPVPVRIRETVSPSALAVRFAVAVADVIGVKRTVTAWVAPKPTRLNGLPETTLKGAELDTVPDTVPPLVFDTVRTWSARAPKFTVPKFTVPVGLTAKPIRAVALAGAEQALSLPLVSTAVTETL